MDKWKITTFLKFVLLTINKILSVSCKLQIKFDLILFIQNTIHRYGNIIKRCLWNISGIRLVNLMQSQLVKPIFILSKRKLIFGFLINYLYFFSSLIIILRSVIE